MKVGEQDSIVLNSTLMSPKTKIEIPTKSYVDSLSENEWRRPDLYRVFNDQDKDFDENKLTNLDKISIGINPISGNELANKSMSMIQGADSILKFNESEQNHIKFSVENDVCNLKNYERKQILDSTIVKRGKAGGLLLHFGEQTVMIEIMVVKYQIL